MNLYVTLKEVLTWRNIQTFNLTKGNYDLFYGHIKQMQLSRLAKKKIVSEN